MTPSILMIDDDPVFSTFILEKFKNKGFLLSLAGSGGEALKSLRQSEPDLILADLNLPDFSGIDLIGKIKKTIPEVPIIMVSASGETRNIVTAMQQGASDYVQKPVDPSELLEKINHLLEIRRIKKTEREFEELSFTSPIIGTSIATRQLIREISRVANSDSTVLLRGESGTGKSLVAEVIHSLSPRKEDRFVSVNCAAIPGNLLETELFGHEKGAFTGAIREKPGRFEIANRGTIFLDEIGDLPPELQVKLLRVLQGHEFERVGGVKTLKVDVRVIAATNRNLDQAILENRFREDLFYRLNVLPIRIPPLRERKEDIPPLVEHFVKDYSRRANRRFEKPSEKVMEHLMSYAWPGNIRELQNVIERAIVLGQEPHLRMPDFLLPTRPSSSFPLSEFHSPFSPPSSPPIASIREIEEQALLQSIQQSGGNIARASKMLGVSRGTVYRRLKKYKIGLKS